jgi:hypothetical protein
MGEPHVDERTNGNPGRTAAKSWMVKRGGPNSPFDGEGV